MFFQYTNTINQIVSNPIVGQTVSLAGRVIAFRRQGGIAFGKLYDASNKIQFSFQKKLIGDLIKNWSDQIKLGVHIGITRFRSTTSVRRCRRSTRYSTTATVSIPTPMTRR